MYPHLFLPVGEVALEESKTPSTCAAGACWKAIARLEVEGTAILYISDAQYRLKSLAQASANH
jgi:hypothetical protein